MTHQPPVPEAATSPYPLHPEPVPEEQKAAAAAAEDKEQAPSETGLSTKFIGIGAAIGLGAVATVGGVLYARGRSGKAAAKSKPPGNDKSKRGRAADRIRVAANEPYEVRCFARKHGIPAAEARAIIKEAGPDRAAANALAARRKKN
jgi:hypothetical protein